MSPTGPDADYPLGKHHGITTDALSPRLETPKAPAGALPLGEQVVGGGQFRQNPIVGGRAAVEVGGAQLRHEP